MPDLDALLRDADSVRRAKEQAIAVQDFPRAAELRDRERALQKQIDAAREAAQEYVLDLRMEPDDLDSSLVADLISRTKADRLVIRGAQKRELMKVAATWGPPAAAAGVLPGSQDIAALYGVPIVVAEDGLTPRQRSVARVLREFPRTRAEQVRDFLNAAHEFRFAS